MSRRTLRLALVAAVLALVTLACGDPLFPEQSNEYNRCPVPPDDTITCPDFGEDGQARK